MRGITRTPLFPILSSQTVNNTRVGNKADMGLIWACLRWGDFLVLSIYAHDFADDNFTNLGSRVRHMPIVRLSRVFRFFLLFWFLQRYTREFSPLNRF